MTDDILKIRPAPRCQWDCVAFGEVMLRFDPGFGRVRNARSFQVWEGGGEYNVARAMRKCWGKRAAVVTALPKNDLGWLVEDLILQGGVDMSHVIWRDFDGLGRNTRVGLNFTEKGFGIRAGARLLGPRPLGRLADQARRSELGEALRRGGRALVPHRRHLRGARRRNTAEAVIEAVRGRRASTAPSSPTTSTTAPRCGRARAARQARRRSTARSRKYVDVMIGNEEDFTACLGLRGRGPRRAHLEDRPGELQEDDRDGRQGVPELQGRRDHAAQREDGDASTTGRAILWAGGEFYEATMRENLEIYDRVGGGDGFASGLAYGFLEGKGPQAAVEYGAAHGALAMTTPGDTSMVTRQGSRGGDEGQGRPRHPLNRLGPNGSASANRCFLSRQT